MPTTTFDLRDTLTSFYLKEVETITVADGYVPYRFIAAYIDDTKYLTTWRLLEEVTIDKDDWELNRFVFRADDSEWLNDGGSHPEERSNLDYALSHCGFIGVMCQKGPEFHEVNANGVMGLDEMRYNLSLAATD